MRFILIYNLLPAFISLSPLIVSLSSANNLQEKGYIPNIYNLPPPVSEEEISDWEFPRLTGYRYQQAFDDKEKNNFLNFTTGTNAGEEQDDDTIRKFLAGNSTIIEDHLEREEITTDHYHNLRLGKKIKKKPATEKEAQEAETSAPNGSTDFEVTYSTPSMEPTSTSAPTELKISNANGPPTNQLDHSSSTLQPTEVNDFSTSQSSPSLAGSVKETSSEINSVTSTVMKNDDESQTLSTITDQATANSLSSRESPSSMVTSVLLVTSSKETPTSTLTTTQPTTKNTPEPEPTTTPTSPTTTIAPSKTTAETPTPKPKTLSDAITSTSASTFTTKEDPRFRLLEDDYSDDFTLPPGVSKLMRTTTTTTTTTLSYEMRLLYGSKDDDISLPPGYEYLTKKTTPPSTPPPAPTPQAGNNYYHQMPFGYYSHRPMPGPFKSFKNIMAPAEQVQPPAVLTPPPPMFHVLPRNIPFNHWQQISMPVDPWGGRTPIFLERGRVKRRYTLAEGNENSWWRKPQPEHCSVPIYITTNCYRRVAKHRWSYNTGDERCYRYIDECSEGKRNSYDSLEKCLTDCWRPRQ